MFEWTTQQQQLLSQQIRADKLPHALLISGVQGAGKTQLANWLLDVFNCLSPNIDSHGILQPCMSCKTCHLVQSNTYPDSFIISNDGKNISVDEVRKAIHFFETTPQIGLGKSLVIANAERMTVSAANALLKTLEEPTNNTLIVQTCVDTEALLPTIISRCQVIKIRPFTGQALAASTPQQNSDDPYLNLTQQQWLNNPDSKTLFEQIELNLIDLLIRQAQGQQQQVNTRTAQLVQSLQQSQAEQGLAMLEKVFSDLIRQNNHWQVRQNLSQHNLEINPKQLWSLYQLVIQAKKKVKLLPQANYNFIVEQLCIEIAQQVN